MDEDERTGELLASMAIEGEVPTERDDPGLYDWLVWILGLVAVLALVGIVVLSILGRTIDAGLAALGGTAVGALASPLSTRK